MTVERDSRARSGTATGLIAFPGSMRPMGSMGSMDFRGQEVCSP
jgi:hypothetical protein